MEAWGHPIEQRARHLRGRLQPDRLLADLEAATDPSRPFVTLIGIKAQTSEQALFDAKLEPEFKAYFTTDPEIAAILAPYRDMGFTFGFTDYYDPSGIELCFAIWRNPEAEARFREMVEGGPASGR